MNLFLDANVLFSAAYSAEGNARALIAAAAEHRLTLAVSAHVLGEARRNLGAKASQALAALAAIEALTCLVPPGTPATEAAVRALGIVPKDAPVLAAAIDCAAEVFVTGDARHFGHLYGQTVLGVRVLGLRAAFEEVAARPPPPPPAQRKRPG